MITEITKWLHKILKDKHHILHMSTPCQCPLTVSLEWGGVSALSVSKKKKTTKKQEIY